MTRDHKPPTAFLPMPLRDVLRGVGTMKDVTEEMLEPAKDFLPGPVRAYLRDTLNALEKAGRRVTTLQVDTTQIAQAAAYLTGADGGRAGADALVHVLADAWHRLGRDHASPHLMFSETVAARAVTRDGLPDAGFGRAAQLLMRLDAAHTIGTMPGTPIALSDAVHKTADLFLIATIGWLLSERAASLDEEQRLLELAVALVRAMEGEIDLTLKDAERVSGDLERIAQLL